MVELVMVALTALVVFGILVSMWRTRSALSLIHLDQDTVDAACLRVALRQFRILLWGLGVLWVVHVVRVVLLLVEWVTR